MLDVLRAVRNFLNRFSEMSVLGVHIDWVFHLTGAAVIMFALTRVLSRTWALRLTIAVLVLKELVDVFAKSRAEYIRPPGLDLAFDLTSGLAGIGLGYLAARRFPRWLSRRRSA
ncbi:MAG: hypothetical protein R3D98_11080 [Candidatus Krumholzibacteriia bacterium]